MHAANAPQTGAITNGGYANWTIQNNTFSHAHGADVSLHGTGVTGLVLADNDIGFGGDLAVHGAGVTNVSVTGNTIHDSNTDGFDPEWEAGGMKMGALVGGTWDSNEIYNNAGPGVWCDINCQDVTISNNRSHDNARAGIMLEISNGASIYGNNVWNNGWANANWGWGANILISSSANVNVYNNTAAWGNVGISVISQNRSDQPSVGTVGISVNNNNIIAGSLTDASLEWLQDWPGILFLPSSNNSGSDNRFWYPGAENGSIRFAWDGCITSITSFSSTPGGQGSRYMSDATVQELLSSTGIPLTSNR
jgi:parallel beta-helix repeat protein